MSYRITRRFQFCAGHRVNGHENKCANIHGHNYVAWVTVESAGLDGLGRVIDFSEVKRIVGGWIDDNWDHTFIVHADDPLAPWVAEMQLKVGNKKPYIMESNPTAENMALELMCHADNLLRDASLKVVEVTLDETENCSATVYDHHHRVFGQLLARTWS